MGASGRKLCLLDFLCYQHAKLKTLCLQVLGAFSNACKHMLLELLDPTLDRLLAVIGHSAGEADDLSLRMLASVRLSKLGVAFALSCCRSSWRPVGSLGDESVCCCCCCCCSRGEDVWLMSVIAHVLVRLPCKCSQGMAELLSVAKHNLASRAAAGKSLPEDLQLMIYCRLEAVATELWKRG